MNSYEKARLRSGMTRERAAAKAGVSMSQLRNIEKGQNTPSVSTAMKLARLYGISLDELTGFCVA